MSSTNRSVPLAAIALLCTIAAACASGSSAGPATQAGSASIPSTASRAPSRGDRTRLDTTDFRGHNYRNLYDAIQTTHSEWLRAVSGTKSLGGTGNGVAATVGVFIDGSQRSMGIDYLKSVNVEEVRQVRHLAASESLINYGPDYSFGAIVVTLRP